MDKSFLEGAVGLGGHRLTHPDADRHTVEKESLHIWFLGRWC